MMELTFAGESEGGLEVAPFGDDFLAVALAVEAVSDSALGPGSLEGWIDSLPGEEARKVLNGAVELVAADCAKLRQKTGYRRAGMEGTHRSCCRP